MGLIKSAISAVGSTLSDQWLDHIVPLKMDNETILSVGVAAVKPGLSAKKQNSGVITDGSLIKVGEGQMMLLVDGGKIVDYSAEAGYFEVKNANAPSMFTGDFNGAVSDAFNRFKFGGATPYNQQVYYINLSEVQNIPFGTTNPINYFDSFYNLELFLRVHGYYSVKIVDPIKFYVEAASKNANYIGVSDFKALYLYEFLTALQTSVGKLAADGVRYSFLPSKNMEIAEHMEAALDEKWGDKRGMEIESVAISGLALTEESQKVIDMRNQGAALSDAEIRAGYVQGSMARGMEAAGSNAAGAMTGYMGVNTGMGSAGDVVAATNANAAAQKQSQAAPQDQQWHCDTCNIDVSGKFCPNCGGKAPEGKFCPNCGNQVGANDKFCNKCGQSL